MISQRVKVLSILCFASLLFFVLGFSLAKAEQKSPSITVLGSAAVSAKPDIARIRIGVVTHNASASKALSENNGIMSKLLNILEEHGIPKEDLQTSSLTLSPQYHHNTRGRVPDIAGYNARNLLQVKVRKLEMLGALLDKAVRVGANRIEGVSFSVADPARLEDSARREAIAAARRKAALYAEATGVKLGRVLTVEEMPGAVPIPRQQLGRAMAVSPVEPGEIEFRAVVTVTYAIEDRG